MYSPIEDIQRLVSTIENNFGTKAAVAGGFARDYVLGGKARDIDLYVEAGAYDVAHWLYRRADMNFQHAAQSSDEYQHQYVVWQMEYVAGFERQREFPVLAKHAVNLVGIDTDKLLDFNGPFGEAVCSRFNIALSQMYIDGNTPRVRTAGEHTTQDINLHRATILRSDWGREGTAKTVRKLKLKYPDLAVSVLNKFGGRWVYDEAKWLAPTLTGPCNAAAYEDVTADDLFSL